MKIAVLGIGSMGFPMARRLCEAGFEVHAWNRSRGKAERLLPFGAQVHDKPAGAVQSAEIVIGMLESGPVVEDVLFRQGAAPARNMLKGDSQVWLGAPEPRSRRVERCLHG